MPAENSDRGDLYVRYHVVCIIDVLAQRNKLAEWSTIPTDGTPDEAFKRALKDSVGAVQQFRDAFEQFFARISETDPSEDNARRLTAAQMEVFRRFRECELHVQQFSDTFVFYSPILNSYREISAEPFYRCLMACSMAMNLSLATGVPVRGGLSLGIGVELEPGNFYGPALAEAHHLESEIAEYPRVVVSDELVAFLRNSKGFSNDRTRDRATDILLRRCADFVARDTDGKHIVDFLGAPVRGMASTIESVSLVARVYRFVNEQVVHFKATGDVKHEKRYSQLKHYIDSRLPLWGLTSESALGQSDQ